MAALLSRVDLDDRTSGSFTLRLLEYCLRAPCGLGAGSVNSSSKSFTGTLGLSRSSRRVLERPLPNESNFVSQSSCDSAVDCTLALIGSSGLSRDPWLAAVEFSSYKKKIILKHISISYERGLN